MINFILGIVAGIALFLLLIYIFGKLDEDNIREQIGEDYEYIIMTKSEIEKYEKYRKEQIENDI